MSAADAMAVLTGQTAGRSLECVLPSPSYGACLPGVCRHTLKEVGKEARLYASWVQGGGAAPRGSSAHSGAARQPANRHPACLYELAREAGPGRLRSHLERGHRGLDRLRAGRREPGRCRLLHSLLGCWCGPQLSARGPAHSRSGCLWGRRHGAAGFSVARDAFRSSFSEERVEISAKRWSITRLGRFSKSGFPGRWVDSAWMQIACCTDWWQVCRTRWEQATHD